MYIACKECGEAPFAFEGQIVEPHKTGCSVGMRDVMDLLAANPDVPMTTPETDPEMNRIHEHHLRAKGN